MRRLTIDKGSRSWLQDCYTSAKGELSRQKTKTNIALNESTNIETKEREALEVNIKCKNRE